MNWKKHNKDVCRCTNCGYNIIVSPTTVKEKWVGSLLATYLECPVCGEKNLKQLDTKQTYDLSRKGVKIQLLQKQNKKLSDKQKNRLKGIEKHLLIARKNLQKYWDEIYQLLNQYESEEKTEMADQEPTLGNQVTSTETLGEKEAEHAV